MISHENGIKNKFQIFLQNQCFCVKIKIILFFQFQVMASQFKIGEKVKKYETFLNEQLRPDLKSVLEQRDKIYEDISEYLALKNSIEAIQSAGCPKPLKTKVDIGPVHLIRPLF